MCELLDARLAGRNFETHWRTTAEGALSALDEQSFDAVVTDLRLCDGSDGLQLCESITSNFPGIPVILMTAWGSMESAIGALRAGAFDFVTKPFEIEALAATLSRALRQRRAKDQIERLAEHAPHPTFDELVGTSEPIQRLCELLGRVSHTESSVLITGESGTGKELVARALHRRSARSDGPFVAINCAAVPESLLESQLFGHVKGAFTDARSSREGLLQRASGGTLFLDEIGDMPLAVQPKLLRALQERSVRPVGGDTEVPFDIRVVAATNRDLDQRVSAGKFRSDLYFRINVIRVDLPPLRARGSDGAAASQSGHTALGRAGGQVGYRAVAARGREIVDV